MDLVVGETAAAVLAAASLAVVDLAVAETAVGETAVVVHSDHCSTLH